jgi:hypothetical protein
MVLGHNIAVLATAAALTSLLVASVMCGSITGYEPGTFPNSRFSLDGGGLDARDDGTTILSRHQHCRHHIPPSEIRPCTIT